jgi:hypothetical protein
MMTYLSTWFTVHKGGFCCGPGHPVEFGICRGGGGDGQCLCARPCPCAQAAHLPGCYLRSSLYTRIIFANPGEGAPASDSCHMCMDGSG